MVNRMQSRTRQPGDKSRPHPFAHSWVKWHHLRVPPLFHTHHGIRTGSPLEGQGGGNGSGQRLT